MDLMTAPTIENEKPRFTLYIVYKSPVEYPGKYIARRWIINDFNMPEGRDVVAVSDNLTVVRQAMENWGLTRIERDASDEPEIVESWV
jgi:hypothetical protein